MQTSFDDLGTPLHEVTFCVLDLETTGGAAGRDAITEFGAVKLRGGECLGTFQTLVNPGVGIPPEIVVLTGITEAMVAPAPVVGRVLPTFLEFLGDAVVVGHNVRFDLRFLHAALECDGREALPNRWLDTCGLARRLLADEVPDYRLGTLASRLRLGHTPCHRALDDALATGDLLHLLLERAGTLGVLGLDDLMELPSVARHPQIGKLRLVAKLPRKPGVYLFRGRGDRVLYVGKASNLRARVRSYFSTDDRRKVSQLLREAETVDHIVCPSPLEASVLEVRLIQRFLPPFNRRSKNWDRYAYLKLTLDEPFPRLAVVRRPKAGDGCIYLGPLASQKAARLIAEAIESAVPIRRCTARPSPSKPPRDGPCTPAQLGVAACPCAGTISVDDYRQLVNTVVHGLTVDPSVLLAPLEARMWALAGADRFEEAADVRDRAAALARALDRQRRLDGLRGAGRVVLEVEEAEAGTGTGRRLVFDGGRLMVPLGGVPVPDGPPTSDAPLPRHLADELACVSAWLDQAGTGVRVVSAEGPWPFGVRAAQRPPQPATWWLPSAALRR